MFEEVETLQEGQDDVQHSHIWDAKKLGRIIYGAMGREGYDSYTDVVVDMARRTGVSMHVNTLSDIKNGKRLPNLEFMAALQITLNIKQSEIAEAIVDDLREKYRQLASS